MNYVNFNRQKGLAFTTSVDANPNTIYFTSDTHEIIVQGNAYGPDISGKVDVADFEETNQVVSAALNDLNDNKQDKTDTSLETENKTIVGAINEVNSKCEGSSVDLSNYLPLTGGTMSGDITMSGESKLIFGNISVYNNSDLFIGGNIQVTGRLYVDNTVRASGFKHATNSSNNYVLLAGGGTKLLSEITAGLATETFVTTKIAEASLSGGDVDLSGYVTKDDLSHYLPLTGGELTGPVHINVVGAGGDTFAENYTNFVTNRALVIGPMEAGSTALYINRGGIQMSRTHTDGESNTSNLSIQAAGGDTTFGGNVNAPKFINTSSTDEYVLLGGGGTKLLSEITDAYLPLTGGVMSGTITFNISDEGTKWIDFGQSNAYIQPAEQAGLVLFGDGAQFELHQNAIVANCNVSASAFYETSDARKKDIKSDISLDKCYDLIDKCQTVIYSLKEQTQEQIGMIAQEVEEFFPELVNTDREGFKSLAYDRLVVICFRVLKDVIKRLEKLENEL